MTASLETDEQIIQELLVANGVNPELAAWYTLNEAAEILGSHASLENLRQYLRQQDGFDESTIGSQVIPMAKFIEQYW